MTPRRIHRILLNTSASTFSRILQKKPKLTPHFAADALV